MKSNLVKYTTVQKGVQCSKFVICIVFKILRDLIFSIINQNHFHQYDLLISFYQHFSHDTIRSARDVTIPNRITMDLKEWCIKIDQST